MLVRGIQAAGEKRHVRGTWIGFWLRCLEKSCRSPLCALDDMVSVRKYRRKKSSRKALGDGKGDQNETRSLDGFSELITRVNQKE